MFKKVVPIVQELHKELKVKPIDNFNFAKNVNIATIMVHEFSKVSAIYPILFLEDKANGNFKPVALLGLKEGENLFVKKGKWEASYIPAIIRRYPFALSKTEEDDKYLICVDEESDFISKKEGEPLFNEDGTTGEVVEKIKTYLAELQQMEKFTNDFCKAIKDYNLFTPLNINIKSKNEERNINGAFMISEEKLNKLSNAKFLDLRKKQYIPAIYAHLLSLSQIERLVTMV